MAREIFFRILKLTTYQLTTQIKSGTGNKIMIEKAYEKREKNMQFLNKRKINKQKNLED